MPVVERRSRSSTRHSDGYNNNYNRHSEHYGNDFNPSVAMRAGGDSRTLSPDRKNSRHDMINGYAKAGSYNQYTMQQPRYIAPHVGSRPPAAIPPPLPAHQPDLQSTSTPQLSPVKYEDFAEGINGSMSPNTRAMMNGTTNATPASKTVNTT